ncbi:phenylacetate--CoA ligase family protein [Flavilitoribacter nigricans]|uniref:Phenylacetate-coenzyme A ligase n=1 Tax=Flavilitoribacter nigricans (strain ATCC 23147 / DSM 23189 / NBRC 102662 / NCIMB 1420 / SS-2) TaxID=1122177 RepID=A0A2D0N503_FLAN2|nr:AMP-binding protein [Flavilitoribacter nigricans]PHN03239.1 phenylacetate--CoA ligase [Flavilitoribacter nigricans DSM 23189 = NBRC 102662]
MYQPKIETFPLEELRRLQDNRLAATMHRMYEKIPFYRQLFESKGIHPNDIRGVADLHRLPFTRKTDLRDNYPFAMFAEPMSEVRRIHASSGTTGKPTVVGYTQNDLDIFDDVVARSLVCAGARPGMKLHNAYGYGLFTGGLGMHGGATKLGMAVIPVSGGMTDRQLTILQDFGPEVICCTPSYAQTLAEECAQRGIDPKALAVQYAVLGAEPWTETIRRQVESGLNVTATNIYGLSEIIGPGVSQEDFEEKGTGSYVWEDHFFPEVVDRNTGEPLPYGEEGVLVFTTITKEAFPLLRYWTNDICSINYDANAKRTHIKMSPIRGRADDMLIIRGVNLFYTQVEEVIEQLDYLQPNYQLVVRRERTMDEVTVRVEVAEGVNKEDARLKNLLAGKIKNTIGISMEVILESFGAIPRSAGGKLSRVVDERKL